MKSAEELRAEASRMRAFALSVTDTGVLWEIEALIVELEARAERLENGTDDGTDEWLVRPH